MAAKLDKLLLVPDTHCPFHSSRAWGLMMKVARDFKPDTLVHMGDLADFYSVSAHSKDPNRVGFLEQELTEVKKLRAQLDRLNAKRKVFVEGNHEQRLVRYLQDKAPELNGLISLDSLLKLSENGWELVPYRRHTKIGKLYLTHDTAAGGKYATARALETFQHSVAIGHHHAIQYHVQGDATGKHQVGAQFGWLGDSGACDYLHSIKAKRNWSLGFGIGYHDRTTHYVYLQPVPIVNFTCVVEGKLFKG